MKVLKEGEVVTVNGSDGKVYKGAFAKSSVKAGPTEHIKTATKVYTNLAEPEFADIVAKRMPTGLGF